MPTISRSGFFLNLPTGGGRAGFNIDIDVRGDAAIEMHFKRTSERALNLRPAWAVIHEDMIEIEKKQFESQGAFRSGGWEPLADSTVARKQNLGLDTRIMVETGRLLASLTNASDKDHKFVPSKSFMLFGTEVPYVQEHMAGVPGHFPARPPIAFNEVDRESWLRIIRGWIIDGAPTKSEGFKAGSRAASTLKGSWI